MDNYLAESYDKALADNERLIKENEYLRTRNPVVSKSYERHYQERYGEMYVLNSELMSVIQMCFVDACSRSGKISKGTARELMKHADTRA